MSIDQRCSLFVKEICKGRDSSHGYEHIHAVMRNSLMIYKGEKIENEEIKELCIVTAWLHDVADHKYDRNGVLKERLLQFLKMNYSHNQKLSLDIIDRISFSKECGNKEDWELILGEKGLLVRNIVSDADKLEALGTVGIERCIEYTKETYRKKYNKEISREELCQEVKKHAEEKLLRLKDEFIRTKTGKKLAIPLHQELVEKLEEL